MYPGLPLLRISRGQVGLRNMREATMNTRVMYGRGVNAEPIWESREFSYPDGKTYWLSTNHKMAGFCHHGDMPSMISWNLSYCAETYQIVTSWGKDVYIDKLIPDAVADLAVKALASD